jgi:UDPglucose--hexose-1-phosphate uridylyltransferase
MHKTSTTLADGRECIFYDRRPVRREVRPDRRSLPDRPPAGRLRFDARTGDWVVIAAHRQDRSVRPNVDDCPLCPTRGEVSTEIPAADYDVVVFENRFPALTTVGAEPADPDTFTGEVDATALRRSAAAFGRCEIICFSSDHDASFADLKPDQARLVVEAWADRTAELGRKPGIRQVFCFENRGADIGATQPHPHGQVYAFPYVTTRTTRMLRQAAAYHRSTGGNLFDDALAADRADADRVVVADDFWTAFVPYAARWPYEVHLYPNRRHRDLTDLDDAELDSLGVIYLDLLQRFDRLFDRPAPYVAAWHQAPAGPVGDGFATHLELFTNRRSNTRLKHLAGTEIGMDAFSNDIGPEAAAARLRELAV